MKYPIFDIVLYHKGCSDGISSAWVVKRHHDQYREEENHELKLIPYNFNPEELPEMDFLRGKNVVFVDICPPLEISQKMQSVCENFYVFDHHKSNAKEHIDQSYFVYDVNRAGCQITWDELFDNQPRPEFLDYIADRDLWRWELPHSKNITSAIYALYYISPNPKYWEENIDRILVREWDETKQNLIQIGGLLHDKTIYTISHIPVYRTKLLIPSESKTDVEKESYDILFASCPHYLSSDLGSYLNENVVDKDDHETFVVMERYDLENHSWYFSTRASSHCKIDLSILTKKLGGGGHQKAAGFQLTGANKEYMKNYFDFSDFESVDVPKRKAPEIPEDFREIMDDFFRKSVVLTAKSALRAKVYSSSSSSTVLALPRPLPALNSEEEIKNLIVGEWKEPLAFWDYNAKENKWSAELFEEQILKPENVLVGDQGGKKIIIDREIKTWKVEGRANERIIRYFPSE